MPKNRKFGLKSAIYGLIAAYFGFIWLDSALWTWVKDDPLYQEYYTAYWYPIKSYVLDIQDYFTDWWDYLWR